jgi:hypothetical protein
MTSDFLAVTGLFDELDELNELVVDVMFGMSVNVFSVDSTSFEAIFAGTAA